MNIGLGLGRLLTGGVQGLLQGQQLRQGREMDMRRLALQEMWRKQQMEQQGREFDYRRGQDARLLSLQQEAQQATEAYRQRNDMRQDAQLDLLRQAAARKPYEERAEFYRGVAPQYENPAAFGPLIGRLQQGENVPQQGFGLDYTPADGRPRPATIFGIPNGTRIPGVADYEKAAGRTKPQIDEANRIAGLKSKEDLARLAADAKNHKTEADFLAANTRGFLQNVTDASQLPLYLSVLRSIWQGSQQGPQGTPPFVPPSPAEGALRGVQDRFNNAGSRLGAQGPPVQLAPPQAAAGAPPALNLGPTVAAGRYARDTSGANLANVRAADIPLAARDRAARTAQGQQRVDAYVENIRNTGDYRKALAQAKNDTLAIQRGKLSLDQQRFVAERALAAAKLDLEERKMLQPGKGEDPASILLRQRIGRMENAINRAREDGDEKTVRELTPHLNNLVKAWENVRKTPPAQAGSGAPDVRGAVLSELQRAESLNGGRPLTEAQRNAISRAVRARLGQ